MSPVKRKIRARLINTISKSIIDKMGHKYEVLKKKQLAEIALENQQLLNTPMPCFMYMNKRYTYPYDAEIPRFLKGVPRTLHYTLIDKVQEILEETFEDKTNKAYIVNLINSCIEISPTLACLKKLIPRDMWCYDQFEMADMKEVFDIDTELTDKEIALFKETNSAGYDAIKILYMEELLLGIN